MTSGNDGQTGPTGETGNGIASITKTGTSGLVDTYTITYTNGNTTTFTVTNGEDSNIPRSEFDTLKEESAKLKTDMDSITDEIYIETGRTFIGEIEDISTNLAVYGSKTRISRTIKEISKIKVYIKENFSEKQADTIYLRFWNLQNGSGGSEIYSKTGSFNNQFEEVEFEFETPIIQNGTDNNFFISVWSKNNKISLLGSATYNSEICTASDNEPNRYIKANNETGDSGYVPSPKNGFYPVLIIYKRRVELKEKSVQESMLSDELKEKINPEKEEQEFFMPKKIYTWGDNITGDWNGERVSKVGVYLDHAIKWGEEEKSIHFEGTNQKNRLEFFTPYPIDWTKNNVNNGKNLQTIEKNYKISGNKIIDVEGTINQISVRNAVGEDDFIALLTIGDSTVEGANAFITKEDGTYFWNTFWNECARQFAMDSIEADNANKYKFMSLGTNVGKGGTSTVEYLNKTRTIITATNGVSGTKLADHLRYVNQHRPSQATWDLLGLGDGTGTDYVDTVANRDLIAQTCESYTGTEQDFTGNPFFDQNKTGTNRFSLLKWLERYRTLDDNGNRLTLGTGTGTKITAENINKINVCTPTHILLQTGLNDYSQVSVSQYIADMIEFVNTVKAQLPNVKIAISLFPDDPGTYYPELYPNISNSTMRYLHDRTRLYIENLYETFKNSNDVDLLPFYFVMPPAESISYRWVQNDIGEKVKVPFGPASNDYHSNGYAHKAWGNQLYAWIKSTLIEE